MTVLLSNCGHDENGRYANGKAGDQSGSEWWVINWYNYPWNVVFRHPDANVRKLIAEYSKAAANNNHIGYDQSQRETFWNALKSVKDYNPKNITKDVETDCSAGVAAIVKAVGYKLNLSKLKNVSSSMWTGSQTAELKNAGFTVLTDSKYISKPDNLVTGDILCNTSCHTAIVCQGNEKTTSNKSAE